MKERVQCTVTAGLAIVGAGVVALTPIAPQAEIVRAADAPVTLTASSIETLAGGVGQSAQNFGSGFIQTPLGVITIAQALAAADGSTNNVSYLALQAFIDGPLYDIDPTLAALDDVLPKALGGGGTGDFQTSAADSGLESFRLDYLYAARTAVRAAVAGPFGVTPGPGVDVPGGPSPVVTLGLGVGGSVTRLAESFVLTPLTPVAVLAAVVEGKPLNQAVYEGIRNNIDGPLWTADPTIDAVAKVLPPALGGGTDGFHESDNGTDGAIINFRDDVLWKTTAAIRTPIRDALGATDPGSTNANARAGVSNTPTATKKVSVLDVLEKSGTTLKKTAAAQHRAVANKPVSTAIKNVQTAVKKAADSLKKAVEPKKPAESKDNESK